MLHPLHDSTKFVTIPCRNGTKVTHEVLVFKSVAKNCIKYRNAEENP